MAIPISIPKFTHLTFLYLLLFSLHPIPISSLNITDLLSSDRDLSRFTSFLTAVASDLSSRSSITILAVPNDRIPTDIPSSSVLSDVLRYHVLLQYLSLSDLRLIPPTGQLVTTLFQATGRASDNSGNVNITYDPSSDTVAFHSLATKSNATLLPVNKTLGHDDAVSILLLNSLLIPYNPDLMASETRPPQGINITKELIDGHDFNVAASMLTASGVVSEFEAAEGGAGITLFVPTDGAFSDLPSSLRFQSLAADKKALVLKYHVLRSYYPLGTLESIVNPIYPTLATEQNGVAGKFTVNISRVNGSVAIDTGVVLASITQTVFDMNPVSIFGVSRVLLPREYFGGGVVMPSAPPPDIAAPSPENPPGMYGPASHLTAPPGTERSAAAAVGVLRVFMTRCCIVLCYVLLL
ncbi:fasciclin-like arabinogalactan protein 4 [Phtheirospermum japonicum]|uniref:Fasciclin-like arabinogalactan protein 4 n=1 Tax=Phtheirospermum japonicum TaxID=374723 RepID=A0A830BAU0_9LAMI|nr:fasciclin-like arabinogalactan protein 4 [Phtheirospermum japonicum]